MSDFRGETFPKPALWGGAGLIGVTLMLVFGTREGLLPPRPTAPQARALHQVAPLASRTLTFADRADGALVITDVSEGRPAMVVATGSESGFIRGVVRGMMRERKLHEASRTAPMVLTQWRDGALTLADTATGRVIELGSFGATNRASFARLLARPVQRAQTDAAVAGKDAA